jgi:Trypsin.
MRRASVRSGVAVLAIALVALSGGAAGAIIGGESTGTRYSNVGALWIHSGTDMWWCSATLISPTVVVTAAHCTGGEFTVDRVDVTFAPVLTVAGGEIAGPSIAGTAHYDPRYLLPVAGGGSKQFIAQQAFDRGVVVLARPAAEVFPGITPAPLPALGTLDAYAASAKAKDSQAFTSVGYGVTREAGSNPNNVVFDGLRRVAFGPMAKLDPELVWIKGNVNSAWGDGGVCSGDSGGPDFLGSASTIVSVHSFGQYPCHNLNASARLDTPTARQFLSAFVPLP